ncbi:general substrate transporter [Saccharata proteae CBS 121410]|uniref:General substrate transporter n=1 Tax=Saccharata proteae CBS 121410 TaxID=1314787 RepID=A0A9P4LW35_9PEZI|nr:general substrate transporter [Saccharata proteae CBS 121410]
MRALDTEDAANEPLIADGASETGSDGVQQEQEHSQVDESALETPSTFIWALTFCAGVSGLLFGYDTGVISSTLISIHTSLSARPLTTLDKSLITSSTSLLALLASPATGILADTYGRRPIILVTSLLFILGALIQALSATVPFMILGRSVVGVAVGSASFVVPLYIGEMAPAKFRGRLVTVQSLFVTGGQVVAYLVGWGFSGREGGWRWMVGLGAAPAVLQALCAGAMPESPRWLVRAGRTEAARRVLGRVYGKGEGLLVEGVLGAVRRDVEEEESARRGRRGVGVKKGGWRGKVEDVGDGFRELVGVGGNRRALVIACMLQGFQQLCGFNSLMYFSATIFSLVGFRSPTLASLSIALTNFLFTLIAFHAIDRVGRRRILLLSVPVMVVGLALCSFGFGGLDGVGEAADVGEGGGGGGPWAVAILVAMVVYVAGYAVGLGNVPWQQSELFPLPVRSLGSALATATNWGSNFLVGLSFLPMMELLGPPTTFAMYAGVCVVGWWTVWRIYPETMGLGLEEVGGLLSRGWGV